MKNKYYAEDYRVGKDVVVEETLTTNGAGGGGCFPKGTFIRTAFGEKPIENCVEGDIILSYDRFGVIDYGQVTALHVHKTEDYVDDIYFIFSQELSLFPQGITGNHAVFDVTTQEHKEIKDFAIGDNLVDLDGNLIEITDILVTPHSEAACTVYNLTVFPQHTFLVGSGSGYIRVHNGGGGKSSGEVRSAQEAPNTLQSSAIAKVLEVISHGEIEGIVGGAKGVYFNGTPVQNSDNSYNFESISFTERKGTASQTVIDGFSDVEQEFAFSPVVLTDTGTVSPELDADMAQARVTIALTEGLWSQDKTNGDLNGYNVRYSIYTKNTVDATYNLVLDKTISGKTTSAYELAHIIDQPAGEARWLIKVVRVSAIDNSAALKSIIAFQRITGIIKQTETYDKIAYVGIKLAAKETGNQIPTRGYDVQGIKVPVPSNYNPITRVYTGDWNLAFTNPSWTDNPAWILHDLIVNEEYGIQNFLGQSVQTDLVAFYEASLYNDCVSWNGLNNIVNLIPDGNGGYEVRFRCNVVIATQQDAWQLLHAIASNMRAVLVMKGNVISLIQDRPRTSKKIFNNSNVIDGVFLYSSSESTTRTTAINCTFNDINDRYLPRTISEPSADTLLTSWYDNAHVRYGYNVKDIISYGVVTESQARRMCKWALYTEINQADLVAFSVGLNICTLIPGDVVTIMDNDYASDTTEYYAGRIVSGATNTFILDTEVTLISGHTYTLGIASLDYEEILEFTVSTASGVTNTLTVTSSIPAGDYSNHEWMLFSTGLVEPRDFLIQSITESAKGIYAISGVFYDANKYATIEQGLNLPPVTYSRLVAAQIPSVTNIAFSEVFMNNGITSTGYIGVTWDWSPATYTVGGETKSYTDPVTFNIRWRRDNNAFKLETGIAVKSFHIPDVTPGNYEVLIETVGLQGKKSLGTIGLYAYRIAGAPSTLDPPIEFYIKGTTGTDFVNTNAALEWKYPASNDNKTDTLYDYVLEIWSADALTKLNSYVVQPIADKFLTDGVTENPYYKGGQFDYSLPYNIADHAGTPARTFIAKLHSRDMVGEVSTANTATISNAAPTISAFSAVPTFEAAYLKATCPDLDISGYIYRRYAAETGGTELDSLDTTSNVIDYKIPTIEVGSPFYYSVAAKDVFGEGAETTRISVTAITVDPDAYTYVSLVFTPNSPSTNSVSWTAFQAYKNGALNTSVVSGNTAWTTGVLYLYLIPGNTALQATTTLTTAVAAGGRILATYKGGTDLTHDYGRAFISGDQLLAGTVGANALVTNTAVITNAAQFGNILQSDSYTWVPGSSASGWRIDKDGWIQAASMTIRNASGQVVFSSNTGAEWSYVNGKPTTLSALNSTDGSKLSGIEANATKNTVYRQTTAPSGGSYTTNDLWVDTDANPVTTYQWSGSAWVAVANAVTNTNQIPVDGAGLGLTAAWNSVTSRPTSLATLNPTDGTTLSTAAADASTALANANNAQTAANTANALLTDIASDSKLTALEKQQVKLEWDNIVNEKAGINAQATALGISTENTNYNNSYNTLSSYITPLLSSLTTTSDIVGTTFRANFADLYTKRQILLNKFSEIAATTATWTSVESRPTSLATLNGTDGTTLSTASSNASTALSGTVNYRTAGAPTNNPVPSGITVTTNSNATANIQLNWNAYTQGARQADFLLIFWKKAGTAPGVNDSSIAVNVNTSASYYIFEGVSPSDTYSFGIAAARRTETGLEIGTIVAPSTSPDWLGVTSGTPNFTANINGVAASTIASAVTNFVPGNDTKNTTPATPTFGTSSGILDYTVNNNGTIDVSFEWLFTAYNGSNGDDKDIDGFVVYLYNNGTTAPTSAVTLNNNTMASLYEVSAAKRSIILTGLLPDTYYTFGVQAYRIVDTSVDVTGVKLSAIAQPTLITTGEFTYGAWKSSTSLAFSGDITGTVNGTSASTVVTNASNGAVAHTGTTNYRNNVEPTNNGAFGTITQSQTVDGNIVVTVPYTYTNGDIPADILYIYNKEGGGTVAGTEPSMAIAPVSGSLNFILKPSTTYSFGIRAGRRVDGGMVFKSIVSSGNIGTSASNFNGSINGTVASTVVSNASSGASAWSKFSGTGSTLPAGNVEFNFANSTTKGGNAVNTDAVGTQSATAVQNTVQNFSTRNDRIATAVVAPVVANSSITYDHTLNTDGSADISFEWTWAGTESDIDGFILYIKDRGTIDPTDVYSTWTAADSVYYLIPSRRAFALQGVAADHYYTFAVQAYRIVDPDINASGVLTSSIIQSISTATETTKGSYRPSSNVAFAGNITGTINGTSAATVVANAANAISAINDMSSDSILSPVEKPSVKLEWEAIITEKPIIEAQATTYGITTEKTTYVNAYNALAAYVPGLLTDLTQPSNITASVFRDTFKAYYDARVALIKKVTDVANTNINTAATTSTWAGISGAGKPADNATVGADFGTTTATEGSQSVTFTATGCTSSSPTTSITRLSGAGAWNAGAYSTVGYNACVLRFKTNSLTNYCAMGLNLTGDKANTSIESLDFCFIVGDGYINIYESGVLQTNGIAYSSTSWLFEIYYDGYSIAYVVNGVEVKRSRTPGELATYYADASLFSPSADINSIVFHQLVISSTDNLTGRITKSSASTFIESAAINAAHIADASITNAAIQNAAITNAKIQNLSVDNAKIADLAVTSAKIQDLAVQTAKIAGNAVTFPVSAFGTQSASITINDTDFPVGTTLLIMGFSSTQQTQSASQTYEAYLRIRYDGVQYRPATRSYNFGNASIVSLFSALTRTMTAGSHTIIVDLDSYGSSFSTDLIIIGLKK